MKITENKPTAHCRILTDLKVFMRMYIDKAITIEIRLTPTANSIFIIPIPATYCKNPAKNVKITVHKR